MSHNYRLILFRASFTTCNTTWPYFIGWGKSQFKVEICKTQSLFPCSYLLIIVLFSIWSTVNPLLPHPVCAFYFSLTLEFKPPKFRDFVSLVHCSVSSTRKGHSISVCGRNKAGRATVSPGEGAAYLEFQIEGENRDGRRYLASAGKTN